MSQLTQDTEKNNNKNKLEQMSQDKLSQNVDETEMEQDNKEDSENECVICLDGKNDHVVVPCGHQCLCKDCGHTVKQCPICRVDIISVMKIFKC